MKSYLGYFNLIKKLDVVLAPSSECPLFIGNCEFLNINYLFNYLMRKSSMSITLNESIFAGGKGFSLYKAVCSSLGEAFERLMACMEYFESKKKLLIGSYDQLTEKGYHLIEPEKITNFSKEQLADTNCLFDAFRRDSVIAWLPMKEMYTEIDTYLPAALISMYYTPQISEEERIGYATSGGLTSHFTEGYGTEHGLLEIMERHEINLSWYCYHPPVRIILDEIKSEKLKPYQSYIVQNHITFYRHNVDQQNFHVITAMSFDDDMTSYAFNAGGGINEDIDDALVAALEEYTQAVNNTRKIVYAPKWLTSIFSNSVLEVNEGDDPRNFKTFYQAVSYYGLECYKHDLDWYVKDNPTVKLSELREKQEKLSIREFVSVHGIHPYYMKLDTMKMFSYIYLSKVYMTEFSPAFIAGTPALGHPTYAKYIDPEKGFNHKILPFP